MEFDIYGIIREDTFNNQLFILFRQLRQYEDVETGLYYNRFRYHDSNTGTYISQDPIKLAGNNPNFYAYVHDGNTFVDLLGLAGTGGADLFGFASGDKYIGKGGSRADESIHFYKNFSSR